MRRILSCGHSTRLSSTSVILRPVWRGSGTRLSRSEGVARDGAGSAEVDRAFDAQDLELRAFDRAVLDLGHLAPGMARVGNRVLMIGWDVRLRYNTSDTRTPTRIANSRSRASVAKKVT